MSFFLSFFLSLFLSSLGARRPEHRRDPRALELWSDFLVWSGEPKVTFFCCFFFFFFSLSLSRSLLSLFRSFSLSLFLSFLLSFLLILSWMHASRGPPAVPSALTGPLNEYFCEGCPILTVLHGGYSTPTISPIKTLRIREHRKATHSRHEFAKLVQDVKFRAPGAFTHQLPAFARPQTLQQPVLSGTFDGPRSLLESLSGQSALHTAGGRA